MEETETMKDWKHINWLSRPRNLGPKPAVEKLRPNSTTTGVSWKAQNRQHRCRQDGACPQRGSESAQAAARTSALGVRVLPHPCWPLPEKAEWLWAEGLLPSGTTHRRTSSLYKTQQRVLVLPTPHPPTHSAPRCL